nr:MAG: wsv440-like protein [Metapenaeopsis lamellata majanivirus]
MENNIANIISWTTFLNCKCKNSERLQRTLNYLLENINNRNIISVDDFEYIKSIIKCKESTSLPIEICNLISTVNLYNFISVPLNFLNRFGITGITTCLCNENRSNYKVWNCFINIKKKIIICPNCLLSCINDDLLSVIDYVSENINDDNANHKELLNLYKSILFCNRPPINGSWASLIINDSPFRIQKTKSMLLKLKGYTLVSNKIQPSRRGRSMCYCLDLLYLFTCIKTQIDKNKTLFGVIPKNIQLVDEEFLLIEYDIFSYNETLLYDDDKIYDIRNKKNLQTSYIYPGNDNDNDKIADTTTITTTTTNNNNNNRENISMKNIFLSILNNKIDDKDIYNNNNNNIAARASALLGDYKNNTMENNIYTNISNNNEHENIKKIGQEIILPPPVIEQTTLKDYYKKENICYITTKDLDGNNLSLKSINVNGVVYPFGCVLLPPPLIVRKSFNKYCLLSNINEYFDEVRYQNNERNIQVNSNILYEKVIKIVNDIREISLTLLCCNQNYENIEEKKNVKNEDDDSDNNDYNDNCYDDDYDTEEDDFYDNNNKKKNMNNTNGSKIKTKVSHVNTQLGIPLDYNEEIMRYINIGNLFHLLKKQEDYLLS